MAATYPGPNPPAKNVQVTSTGTAATLQSLMSAANPYPNRAGIQLLGLSTNGASVFWDGAANASVTTGTGSEIAAGNAQVVSPAQAADTSEIYLIGVGVVCVSFLGG